MSASYSNLFTRGAAGCAPKFRPKLVETIGKRHKLEFFYRLLVMRNNGLEKTGDYRQDKRKRAEGRQTRKYLDSLAVAPTGFRIVDVQFTE